MRKRAGFEKRTGLQNYAWLAVAVAVCLVTATAASAQVVRFYPAMSFTVGDAPRAVAIGDLNADGKPDLAVANEVSHDVSVLLGKGDGTFLPATTFAAGTAAEGPFSIAIGDLNVDGKPDLAVVLRSPDVVSVLLGNGDGTFLPATSFTVGTTPISVAIGDVNGDGKPDLAVANEGSLNVSVLLGNGDGTFLPASNFTVGAFPRSVAIGDLNGDGKSDMAVASRFPSHVSVLLGNGDGTFPTPFNFTAGIEPRSVAIGDLNGDGKPDLAVANSDGSTSTVDTVSVLLGNGDGTFLPATNFTVGGAEISIAGGDRSVAIGDLNGDGKPDLAVPNSDNVFATVDVVSVLLGKGDGTFRPATNFTVGADPISVAIGDLNGDGRPDLVTTNPSSDDVSLLLNRTRRRR